jgi:hypothetical protein
MCGYTKELLSYFVDGTALGAEDYEHLVNAGLVDCVEKEQYNEYALTKAGALALKTLT